MKSCFGLGFGGHFEDNVETTNTREECHGCEDFDRCFHVTLIRQLVGIRTEIRAGAGRIKKSIGGSHQEFPFG